MIVHIPHTDINITNVIFFSFFFFFFFFFSFSILELEDH